jgi:hypothetical protein
MKSSKLSASTGSKSKTSSPSTPTKITDLPRDMLEKIFNNNAETVRAIRTATKKFNNLLSTSGKENGKYLSQYFKDLVNAPPLPQNADVHASDLILIPTKESKLPQITLGYNQWNPSYAQRFDIFMAHKNLKKMPIIRTNNAGQFWVQTRDADQINKDLSNVLDHLSAVKIVRGKETQNIKAWNKNLSAKTKKI